MSMTKPMTLKEYQAKRDALRDRLTKLEQQAEAQRTELLQFEAMMDNAVLMVPKDTVKKTAEEAPTPVKKTRGRKAKAKAKPEPKAKAKAKGGRKTKNRSTPPLKKAIIEVLGDQTMKASEVITALEGKGWCPESDNIAQYINFMLSSNTPETFERVARGVYKVRQSGETTSEQPKKAKAKDNGNGRLAKKIKKDWGVGTNDNIEGNPYAVS
jgi:hypothetical protein